MKVHQTGESDGQSSDSELHPLWAFPSFVLSVFSFNNVVFLSCVFDPAVLVPSACVVSVHRRG